MKQKLILNITVVLMGFTTFSASAAIESLGFGPQWTCNLDKQKNYQGYTCSKGRYERRAVVTAQTSAAKPSSMSTMLKILNSTKRPSAEPAAKIIQLNGHDWIEATQHIKDLPLPARVLYTIKDNTAFRFVVIANPIDFEGLKREIQTVVENAK